MKYETKLQIQAALAKRGWTHAAQVINEFVEALESTDEQKALREDAERWRKWIIAAKAPTGYEPADG